MSNSNLTDPKNTNGSDDSSNVVGGIILIAIIALIMFGCSGGCGKSSSSSSSSSSSKYTQEQLEEAKRYHDALEDLKSKSKSMIGIQTLYRIDAPAIN